VVLRCWLKHRTGPLAAAGEAARCALLQQFVLYSVVAAFGRAVYYCGGCSCWHAAAGCINACMQQKASNVESCCTLHVVIQQLYIK
jgi:hypothetical protein